MVRSYLWTTGILFGLFSVWHIVEFFRNIGSATVDSGLLVTVALIALTTAALCWWAFGLLKTLDRR
jgi:hypothetical protein